MDNNTPSEQLTNTPNTDTPSAQQHAPASPMPPAKSSALLESLLEPTTLGSATNKEKLFPDDPPPKPPKPPKPAPTVNPAASILPPCPALPISLSDEQYRQLDEAKRVRRTITCKVNDADNSIQINTGKCDLFYEKTIFELQTTLNQIKEYRKSLDPNTGLVKNDQGYASLSKKPTTSPPTGPTVSPMGTITDPNPAAGALQIEIKKDAASKVDFTGGRVDVLTLRDLDIPKTGEPIADAFARLVQMLLMLISAMQAKASADQIRSLRMEIKAELKELAILDNQHGSNNIQVARSCIPTALQDYIDSPDNSPDKVRDLREKAYQDPSVKAAMKEGRAPIMTVESKGLSTSDINRIVTDKDGYNALNGDPRERLGAAQSAALSQSHNNDHEQKKQKLK